MLDASSTLYMDKIVTKPEGSASSTSASRAARTSGQMQIGVETVAINALRPLIPLRS